MCRSTTFLLPPQGGIQSGSASLPLHRKEISNFSEWPRHSLRDSKRAEKSGSAELPTWAWEARNRYACTILALYIRAALLPLQESSALQLPQARERVSKGCDSYSLQYLLQGTLPRELQERPHARETHVESIWF